MNIPATSKYMVVIKEPIFPWNKTSKPDLDCLHALVGVTYTLIEKKAMASLVKTNPQSH